MSDLNAYEKIVPRAIPEGGATVKTFDFAVRTLLDYDASWMSDRVHASIFIDGKPTGIYSSKHIDEMPGSADERAGALELHGKAVERVAIDAFLDTGWREETVQLGREIRTLLERIAYLERVRWWQLRRRVADWWSDR